MSSMPDTQDADARAAAARYLAEVCPGVGPQRAAALVERFGPQAPAAMRTYLDPPIDAGILNRPQAARARAALVNHLDDEALTLALYALFNGTDLPMRALATACRDEWGEDAPAIIRASPYALLARRLPGCSFRRVDVLYLKLGNDPAALTRQAWWMWDFIRCDRMGDTWLPADEVARELKAAIEGASPRRAILHATAYGDEDGCGLLVRRRDAQGKLWLATAEDAGAEERAAAGVRRLMSAASP